MGHIYKRKDALGTFDTPNLKQPASLSFHREPGLGAGVGGQKL